jgi:4-hydroxybenzoyl-CoA thioesterase
MLKNRKTIHIEWGDCDPAGIVYFPRYFAFFDNCTAALFEAAGLPKYEMIKEQGIIGIPIVDTRARFLRPSRFGEDVVIESSISEWRRSSFDVHHRLWKSDILAVECFETRVWAARSATNPGRIEARPVPPEIIRKFGDRRATRTKRQGRGK